MFDSSAFRIVDVNSFDKIHKKNIAGWMPGQLFQEACQREKAGQVRAGGCFHSFESLQCGIPKPCGMWICVLCIVYVAETASGEYPALPSGLRF